ncbi:hypothetical protein ACHWQZ_G014207 [Mnemiopsis leidyi]
MDKAILCNLLSYEVKEVELSDLYSKCENSNIQDAVISYFQDLADQKLHIYALNYDHDSGFLGSLKDPNKCISLTSLKCEDDLMNGVIVMILDLFLIGQCTLKKESFTSELDAGNMPEIYKERLSALYMGHRLEDSKLPVMNQESRIDNLINICNIFTSQTCKILRCKIEERNYNPDWANILKEGDIVSISFTKQLMLYDLKIESDVFDAIERHSRGELKIPKLKGKLNAIGNPGAFGSVYSYQPDDQPVSIVIKRNKRCHYSKDELNWKPAWYREVHHTLDLCHENVIKYYTKPILYGDVYYCIMEYGGVSLEDQYCSSGPKGVGCVMKLKDICNVSFQISCAINYLHSRKSRIIHRDIRTANVTYDNTSGLYKLIDFGLSSEKNEEESSNIVSNTNWGNHLWKSPEFCWHDIEPHRCASAIKLPKPGRKSDIWMFGIFLLELVAFPGRPSFFKDFGKHDRTFKTSLTDKSFDIKGSIEECLTSRTFGENKKLKKNFETILQRCLEFYPEKRASSEEIEDLCRQLLE